MVVDILDMVRGERLGLAKGEVLRIACVILEVWADFVVEQACENKRGESVISSRCFEYLEASEFISSSRFRDSIKSQYLVIENSTCVFSKQRVLDRTTRS